MIFEFIVLLSSWASVAGLAKCLLLNDERCMFRPTLIDMNPNELKYHSFMVNLNKSTGSCNVLSPKIYVPKEARDINVKAFNMHYQVRFYCFVAG